MKHSVKLIVTTDNQQVLESRNSKFAG